MNPRLRKLWRGLAVWNGSGAYGARRDPDACRLMRIANVGPVTAHAVIAAIGDGRRFASARDFAA